MGSGGSRPSVVRSTSRNGDESREDDEQTWEDETKQRPASKDEQPEVDPETVEIPYSHTAAKLDLTYSVVTSNALFAKALSQHKNPQVVKELSVRNKTSITEIPLSIGHYENIVTLNLHNNKLSDLPWSVIYLRKLEKLDLSQNFFEHIPRVIGYLTNLRELNFKKNFLATIPYELTKLQNLRKIDLTGNERMKSHFANAALTKVEMVFSIIRDRQQRNDLWANSKPWVGHNASSFYGKIVPTLHEMAVDSILKHKVSFLMFSTIPPKMKTFLTECEEEERCSIKVAKCSRCKHFYSSKELFENHFCQAG